MKFEEIFNRPGLYKSEGFAEGACFEIKSNSTLFINTYKDENDLFPTSEIMPVYAGLFKKDYIQVYTRKSLFVKK